MRKSVEQREFVEISIENRVSSAGDKIIWERQVGVLRRQRILRRKVFCFKRGCISFPVTNQEEFVTKNLPHPSYD